MEWIETSADSVDEAKEAALAILLVHADEAEFEILQEPKRGLLGKIKEQARVRARITPRKREDNRDQRRRKDGRDKRNQGSRPNRSGSRSKTTTAEAEKSTRPAKNDQGVPSRTKAVDAVSVEEVTSRGTEFLVGLLDAMGLSGSVRNEQSEDLVMFFIEGDQLGILIGPRGQTLDAIQTLTRAASQRDHGGPRVRVDVAGYREKRKDALLRYVEKVAEEVRASGRSRTLEPMPSSDRKVVHDAVGDIDGISSGSVGDDPRRSVVIRPE